MDTYQWRTATTYASTTTLSHGVTPNTESSWQTASSGEMEARTYQYWYRDANVEVSGQFTDANSSRVVVTLTEYWRTAIRAGNVLSVSLVTTIDSIIRNDCVGYNQDTPGRVLTLSREHGGTAVWTGTDTQIATPHTILGTPITLAEYGFELAPGDTTIVHPSLYLHNQTIGYDSYDDISLGVQFRNILPADYRPGATRNNASKWMSHDRSTGMAKIWNGASWIELRTVSGDGSTAGNPPYIRNNSGIWANQRRIGNDA